MSSTASSSTATDPHCPLLPVVGGELLVPLADGSESRYVNLDYAASAPALESVWHRVAEVMPFYASVHRGAGYASQVSTAAYENARVVVGRFVAARPSDSVVFTRNTTDSLALLSSIVPGEVVVLDIEHHANLLPWLAADARVVRAADTLEETIAALTRELVARPAALLTVTGASNVTGETLPLRRLATLAHRHGARLAVDGAQLVPHRRVDVAALGIDYLAFSGHKAYAPFGAGVLLGRSDWLDAAPPYLRGGGAVSAVSFEETVWRTGPARHEAGSPNVVGAVALASALEAIAAVDEARWLAHERALRDALVSGLAAIEEVQLLRIFDEETDAVGVVSFVVDGVDARELARFLSAERGIGIRDGRFCAHPLLSRLGVDLPALRASVGLGSRLADVEALVGAVRDFLDGAAAGRYARPASEEDSVERGLPRPDWAREEDGAAGSLGCAAA